VLVVGSISPKHRIHTVEKASIVSQILLMMKEVEVAICLPWQQSVGTPRELIPRVAVRTLPAPHEVPAKHSCHVHAVAEHRGTYHHRNHIAEDELQGMSVQRCQTKRHLMLMVNFMDRRVQAWVM